MQPQEVVRWAVDVYGERLTLSVSFGGAEGMVLLDMLSRTPGGASVRVFTLDTGFLFEETVRFREGVMEHHPSPREMVRPALSLEDRARRGSWALRHGPRALWLSRPRRRAGDLTVGRFGSSRGIRRVPTLGRRREDDTLAREL